MITYKGRVVYEREKHFMTEKDAARIMAAVTEDLTPRELAKKLWWMDLEIVKAQVLDDEALLQFAQEFIILVIKWIGVATAWLWDLLSSWLIAPAPQPPPPPMEEENGR